MIFKWLGIVNLQLNRLRDGITYPNQSNNLTAGVRLVLQNLVRAYYTIAEFDRDDQTLALLEPHDIIAVKLQNYRRVMLGKFNQIQSLFENALTNFRKKITNPP